MTLTREQVDAIIAEAKHYESDLPLYDAVLWQRATIEALQQEVEMSAETIVALLVEKKALEKDKERYRLDAEEHYRAATEFEQQLTAARAELQHWREAAASVGETDGHGWVVTTNAAQQRVALLEQFFSNPELDLLTALTASQQRVEELEHNYAQVKEAYEAASKGQPIGPVIGAQTIINQQLHIQKIETALTALEGALEAVLTLERLLKQKFDHCGAMNATQLDDRDHVLRVLKQAQQALAPRLEEGE